LKQLLVVFAKPIDKRLLIEINLADMDIKRDECVESLAPFMKEGFNKGVQAELRDRQDATSKYLLAALLTHNESVVGCIRRELRKVVDVLVEDDEIIKVLTAEVIKRETLDGPEAESAARRINRTEARSLRASKDLTDSAKQTCTPESAKQPPETKPAQQ
jgi:hypothetical protein